MDKQSTQRERRGGNVRSYHTVEECYVESPNFAWTRTFISHIFSESEKKQGLPLWHSLEENGDTGLEEKCTHSFILTLTASTCTIGLMSRYS